jgi:acetoin utilization deacetylase AcuC-like enzyme
MNDLTAIAWPETSALHDTGGHPENQRRLVALRERLDHERRFERHPMVSSELATEDDLTLVHSIEHVDIIRRIAEQGGGAIDADTWVSPGSFDAARGAAGAVIAAVDASLSGAHQRVFAMHRPPGHHAERSRAMGFCLFNSVAVGAQYAIARHGLRRVAIVDWDVHHGNGTQEIFYDRDDVLFMSVHQWPLFPGTGLEHEQGTGKGAGFTLNVPLGSGATDDDYLRVFDDVFYPRARDFAPDLLMVSAGFDGHRADPLATMHLTERGFGALGARARSWADELSGGRLILSLEGGYNIQALAASVSMTLDGLDRHGELAGREEPT